MFRVFKCSVPFREIVPAEHRGCCVRAVIDIDTISMVQPAVLLHHLDQGCYQQVSWLTSSSCKCPSNLRTTGHWLRDRRSLTGFIRRPAVKCRYVGGSRDAGILRTGRGGSDRVLPPL